MTNANVEQTVSSVEGQTLMMKYKDGEKKIIVPADTPIVTYAPGDKSDLKPGTKIFINAMGQAGQDFEKGEADGTSDALDVLEAIAGTAKLSFREAGFSPIASCKRKVAGAVAERAGRDAPGLAG